MHGLGGGAQRREFERFVRERTGPLLRTAYLLAGDLAEAEDLVQETLLRVARRWYKVAAMEQPGAYARQILVNLVIDHAGQRARRNRELAAPRAGLAAEPADDAAERALLAVNTQALLLAALTALPPRQRAVIVLRYWDDLPEAEVATILGCSAGTVKSTASRGLARLRQALGAEPSVGSLQAP
jgi:RNA polymerase sigma-70 factor (sigma-E family)